MIIEYHNVTVSLLREIIWHNDNYDFHRINGSAYADINSYGTYIINGKILTREEYIMTKEKEDEEIVSVISTNDKKVEEGSVEDYLTYEHGIPLNHNQFTSLAKKIKVEDDEYVNLTDGIDSNFVLCFHDEYMIKFKTEEDLCMFKLDNAECLHATE